MQIVQTRVYGDHPGRFMDQNLQLVVGRGSSPSDGRAGTLLRARSNRPRNMDECVHRDLMRTPRPRHDLEASRGQLSCTSESQMLRSPLARRSIAVRFSALQAPGSTAVAAALYLCWHWVA